MRRMQLLALAVLLPGVAQADWVNSDVPLGLVPEGAAIEDPPGTWTVDGAGVDIWGTSDEFHYLYEEDPIAGDFAISCHVVSLGNTPSPWGKAGIMARAGAPDFLGPESYAYCCATTGNGVCLQWRDGEGVAAAWNNATTQYMAGPEDVWIKLVREGDEFFGYTAVQRPLWMSLSSYYMSSLIGVDEVYVGLAVTSHTSGSAAQAVFDEIEMEDPGISHSGPSDLTCTADGDNVNIEWTNNSTYDEIALFRRDLGGQLTRVDPGPNPDAVSFTDSPGDGIWEYWISAVDGGMECLATSCSGVPLGELGYAGEVLSDDPVAYWRLGETAGLIAQNWGTTGSSLNGTYTGGFQLDQDSLLPSGEDRCVLFDGVDTEVRLPDHNSINTGGPHTLRSIEFWFLADMITTTPGVLFEEGGNTRGISIYVVEENTRLFLVMNAWNMAEEAWGPLYVAALIEEGEVYHAVMVFQASEDEVFGNFDGRITGYLNGEEFDTAGGADQLYAHGDDGAIGGIHTNTRLYDSTTQADGGSFMGLIDEVAVYNICLDDPDGDGDMGDSRVEAHFDAGGSEVAIKFQRADANGDDLFNITDAVFTLNYLFLGGDTPTCMDAADADDDGVINLSDGIYTLNFLFLGGPVPPPPGDSCGTDPTDGDPFGCESYPAC